MNALSDVDPSCFAANNLSFPATHGIATAVEQPVRDVPQDPTVAALKRNLQLDMNWRSHNATEPLTAQAPLASPEPLSETSSLASFGSDSFRRQLSGDRRWFTRAAMRMDPIKQSPLCRSSPPSTRLASAQSGPVSGLCFPVEEILQNSNSESEPESAACSVVQTASAVVRPSTLCQTVVEVHHHQDSPTQNEASKSIEDIVSVQVNDSTSAEILSVDIPFALVTSSAVSADEHEILNEDLSLTDNNHCPHVATDCCSNCKCNVSVSESENVGDGQSYHLSEPEPHFDDTSDDVCAIVDPELSVNRVIVDRL